MIADNHGLSDVRHASNGRGWTTVDSTRLRWRCSFVTTLRGVEVVMYPCGRWHGVVGQQLG